MTVLEVLEQAKALSPQERKQLVKLLVDTLNISDALAGVLSPYLSSPDYSSLSSISASSA